MTINLKHEPSTSPWAQPGEWIPHEKPTVPEVVGTDIIPEEDGSVTVRRFQDVEPILDWCKEQTNAGLYRTPSGDMHHAAELPMALVEKYMADKGIDFHEFMNNTVHVKAMLADPALRDFCIARNVVHKTYR